MRNSILTLVTFFLIVSYNFAYADDRTAMSPQEQQVVVERCLASMPATVTVVSTGPKFSLSSALLSQYVSPHGYVVSDETVLQSDFKVTWTSGINADVWWSTGLNGGGFSSDSADEIDLSLGWAKKIGDYSLTVGATYFDFVELNQNKSDLFGVQAEFSRRFQLSPDHTLEPFARMEERWRLPDFDWARSWPVVGVKDSWTVAPGFTLNQRLGFLYDSGVPVSDDGWLLQYKVGLNCKVSEFVSVEPFFRLSLPLTIEDKREEQMVIGFSLTVNL